ncbi:MAG TPA: plastocyanin/azurin family copper-binding protein [Chthoniobacterales bacterium]
MPSVAGPDLRGQGGKPSAITIVDQQGRVSLSVPASATGNTVNVSVGSGGSRFVPATVNILVGDTVQWTWAASGHNVRSGTPCSTDGQFCSPNDTNCASAPTSNLNATYSHTFTQPGSYSYFCSVHCLSGMTGTVSVTLPSITITSVTSDANGFTITGQTTANTTVTVKASPDLITEFQTAGTRTSNTSGIFTFSDMSPTMHFYRVTYP